MTVGQSEGWCEEEVISRITPRNLQSMPGLETVSCKIRGNDFVKDQLQRYWIVSLYRHICKHFWLLKGLYLFPQQIVKYYFEIKERIEFGC